MSDGIRLLALQPLVQARPGAAPDESLGLSFAGALIVQLVGARKALHNRIPYNLPWMHGKPENVARDMWTMGSGLAAPGLLLVAHAAGIVLVLARPRPWLQRVLGCLGAIYIPGILGERVTWESFRHPERKNAPLIAWPWSWRLPWPGSVWPTRACRRRAAARTKMMRRHYRASHDRRATHCRSPMLAEASRAT